MVSQDNGQRHFVDMTTLEKQSEIQAAQNREMIEHTKSLMRLACELSIDYVKVGGIEIKTTPRSFSGEVLVPSSVPLPPEMTKEDIPISEEDLLLYSAEQ